MNLILRLLLFPVAALVFLQGCYRDEILTPPINPSNLPHKLGVYVLSEGKGASDESKLSFLSYANGDFSYNITFPGVLGLYPDGISEYFGTLYVTERGAANSQGKIYKMDTNGVITATNNIGLNPYSIAVANDKAYCTNGPDSSVSVIDLNTLAEIKRIKIGLYPQEIKSLNTKIFVANTRSPAGGIDSTISVIDIITNAEIFRLKINAAPSSLAVSRDGYLLVGSSGSGGMIYKVHPVTYQKADSFFVNSLTVGDINVDYNSNNIYFIRDRNSIVRLDLTTRVTSPVIVAGSSNEVQYINGYAYDIKSQKHYIADAKDFIRAGYLYKFSSSGTAEAGFQTGISPRRIMIRN